MTRPTSFRLSEELLERLDDEAATSGTSVSALVTSLLGEGLKTRQFPGIVYRDGPMGRRAALVGGPDVWEIVRTIKAARGRQEQRVRVASEGLDLPAQLIRLAVDFYAAFPDEIDQRIVVDERATLRSRNLVAERDRLLST